MDSARSVYNNCQIAEIHGINEIGGFPGPAVGEGQHAGCLYGALAAGMGESGELGGAVDDAATRANPDDGRTLPAVSLTSADDGTTVLCGQHNHHLPDVGPPEPFHEASPNPRSDHAY